MEFIPKEELYKPAKSSTDSKYGKVLMESKPDMGKVMFGNAFYFIGAIFVLWFFFNNRLNMLEYGYLGIGVFVAVIIGAVVLAVSTLRDMVSGVMGSITFYSEGMVIKNASGTKYYAYDDITTIRGKHVVDQSETDEFSNDESVKKLDSKLKSWESALVLADGSVKVLSEKEYPSIGRKLAYLRSNLFDNPNNQ